MNTFIELNNVGTVSNQSPALTATVATNKLHGRQISITEDYQPNNRLTFMGKLSVAVLAVGAIAYSVYSTQVDSFQPAEKNNLPVVPIRQNDTVDNPLNDFANFHQQICPDPFFNGSDFSPKPRVISKIENNLTKGSIQQVNNTASGEICVDPKTIFDEIYLSGSLRPITEAEMEVKFGLEQRSMTTTETREFYNVIAKANREIGDKLIKEFGNNSTQLYQGASACCETRHNAKVYVRKLGPAMGEMFAKALDFSRHWDTEGLRCKSLFKKYKNNPRIVIDKAASPNNDVNRFAENLDKGIMHAVSIEIKALFA